MSNNVIDNSKDYRGQPLDTKTTNLILTKADGTEITITAEQLEVLLAGS